MNASKSMYLIGGAIVLLLVIVFVAKSGPATMPVDTSATAANTIINPPAQPQMITNSDGLMWQDVQVGTGAEAMVGDTVTVDYEGTLANGTKFDSSVDRGTPFTFKIGEGKVIKGFDEGVVGMKVGGIRKLVIPPALAYGNSGHALAEETLTFVITFKSK